VFRKRMIDLKVFDVTVDDIRGNHVNALHITSLLQCWDCFQMLKKNKLNINVERRVNSSAGDI